MIMPNAERIVDMMQDKNHIVFHGDYDLNIVGLRTMPGVANRFDDYICVFYKLLDVWQFHCWQGTTDPGTYYLINPMHSRGTAILQPGQYRSCWTLGKHSNNYITPVQTGMPFKVWRDRDRDGGPDYFGPTYYDATGINLHHAGAASSRIDKWSAGCPVIARLEDWEECIRLCYKQITHGHGTKFSFTLLEWQ